MLNRSSSLKRFTFTKADRIRTSKEYRSLSNNGIRHYSECFIIISKRNQFKRHRLGITVSKRVGKAVTRNRIKRIIREYFRVEKSLLPSHMDINIIARQQSGRIEAEALRENLGKWLASIAVRPEQQNNE